jgi:hypothetical protein
MASKGLQVIVRRLIADTDGTIADYELNSPFALLYQLAKSNGSSDAPSRSST